MSGKIAVKKFYEGLLRDILLMLNNADDYDVTIQVGKNQNIKEFRAHSNILRARSKYFKTALSENWIAKKNNLIEFKKPNISPDIFDIILKYIYTGKIRLTDESGEDILGLIVAFKELLFNDILIYLENCMINYQLRWIQQNLVFVLHTVSKIPECKKLRDYCIKFIVEDPQIFITSKDFLSLDEDILFELLKRDDLQVEEIVIWDYLIKWVIEQTTGLGSENGDKTKWNNENCEALKEKLEKFIPLIRFSEISSDDFFDKIRPFEAIIPRNIYEEVLKYYMKGTLSEGITTLPPRVGMIDIESKIIKPKHAFIIANWIDRKDEKAIRNKSDLKYNFKRLYFSGWHGTNIMAINRVRDRCKDNRDPHLILVNQRQNTNNTFQQKSRNVVSQEKISQDFKKIYGEYYSFIPHNERFIFSFENDNVKNTKISRNINDSISFNSFNDSSGQNVHVKMSDYCNGNVVWKNENFVPKEVEIFIVYKNK
ncbi:hypothetical protein C1646_793778 [Rhizophagus diaphanus]|nr:hypothetical protein C1646_793778 [Rhizophagus diaphanus] [Rhizophagus sp. MUCL 43196]